MRQMIASYVFRLVTSDATQLTQFMNYYLFSGNASTTVNPDEKTLHNALKATQDASLKAKAGQDDLNKPTDASPYPRFRNESESDYGLRVRRLNQAEENQRRLRDLQDPNNCSKNFANYLNTPFASIEQKYVGQTIYGVLTQSLGSTEGGFELNLDYRPQNILSNHSSEQIREMITYAQQPQQLQQFIDALCKNGTAVKILLLANKKEESSVNQYTQQSQPYTQYETNVWNALRFCLQQLEQFIFQMEVQGGKSRSRSRSKSKSNRKKRISHRQKKHHGHKRRTPKRR